MSMKNHKMNLRPIVGAMIMALARQSPWQP